MHFNISSARKYKTEKIFSDSTIHIKENGCITGVIHHVVAKDVDEGDNGQIVYSVVDSSLNDAFEINQTTGGKKTSKLFKCLVWLLECQEMCVLIYV